MLKLSVIMPIYNAEDFLDNSISSVLNSTYENIELLLIDDGSSDNSKMICDKYCADKRVIYYYQQNSGSQNARAKGIELSTGEYITFCDSDDIVSPIMYSELMKSACAENADFTACSFSRENLPPSPSNAIFEVIEGSDKISQCIVSRCGGYLWNKVYKRECLDKVSFNKDINLGEDGLFNLQLAEKINKISVTDEKMYYYRPNASSITKTHFRPYAKWKKEIYAYKEYIAWPSANIVRYCSRMFANCLVKGAESCINEKNKKQYKQLHQLAKAQKITTFSSKNTQKQYFLIAHLPFIFSLLKKIQFKLMK